MFIPDTFKTLRKHTQDAVKVFAWVPIATRSCFFYWMEDRVGSIEMEAARRGISFDEAAREVRKLPWCILYSLLTGQLLIGHAAIWKGDADSCGPSHVRL